MKIAALISGGVDSAVAVHRLVEQGHDVHLFYIRIGLDNGEGDCSAEEDIEMCTFIAKHYGLPFEVVSLHQEYWDSVMAPAFIKISEFDDTITHNVRIWSQPLFYCFKCIGHNRIPIFLVQ